MRGLVQRLASVGVLVAGAMLASGPVEAAPISAPKAMEAALEELAVTEHAQFVYLGKPYCWYPYGWAGAGWYWCGYGTRRDLTANDTSRHFLPGNREKPLAYAAFAYHCRDMGRRQQTRCWVTPMLPRDWRPHGDGTHRYLY
jgi:hypothetical protein